MRDKVRDIFQIFRSYFLFRLSLWISLKNSGILNWARVIHPTKKMSILTNLLIVFLLENEVFCIYTGEVVLLYFYSRGFFKNASKTKKVPMPSGFLGTHL